jgi:anti-sigma regulatory factor (Ser/Thr protein kinase)
VGRASRSRRPTTRAKQPPRAPLLSISVPSQTSFLGLIREITQKLAEGAGFDHATAGKLALAVDEAATNVIEHAYAGAPDRELELRYDNRAREFRVDVVDNGAMVDPRAVPRVDLDRYVSERRTGGLGVHLMERIMDSVTFRRSARKNVCRLVKLKDRDAPGTGK